MAPKREQILWQSVWSISERLEKIFSLKAILSAGILVFDKLSAEQKQEMIAEANGIIKTEKKTEPTISESIETIKTFVRYKIPSANEQREIESLRQALEAEPKKELKRKRG
jgi:hypothetical protein